VCLDQRDSDIGEIDRHRGNDRDRRQARPSHGRQSERADQDHVAAEPADEEARFRVVGKRRRQTDRLHPTRSQGGTETVGQAHRGVCSEYRSRI
jgi:hypothetical protein